jgi:hypothetical protein
MKITALRSLTRLDALLQLMLLVVALTPLLPVSESVALALQRPIADTHSLDGEFCDVSGCLVCCENIDDVKKRVI